MKKLSEFFKRNTMLKVFSLLIAILLWAYVQVAENPEVSYQILEVPITIEGEAILNNGSLIISNSQQNLVTNVIVSTQRSHSNSVDVSDIIASVDVSALTQTGNYTLPVDVHSKDASVNIHAQGTDTISLYVDRIITIERDVIPTYYGQLDGKYYADIDNATFTPNPVKIKCPESKANSIHDVLVQVPMSELTGEGTISLQGTPRNDKKMELDDDSVSILDEIKVQIPVLRWKEVSIKITNPPEHWNGKYKLNHSTIEVAVYPEHYDSVEYVEGSIVYNPNKTDREYQVTLQLGDKIGAIPDQKPIILTPPTP